MNYLEINIPVDSKLQDIIIAYLSNLDFDSFEQEDKLIKAFILSEKFNEEALKEVLSSYNIETFKISPLENKNWNEEWEKNFPDTVVNDKIHVRASFHKKIENIPFEIIIEPKMSFGTGNHPTTYQVMEAMLELDMNNKTLLDIGSGTGILAILAEKMGAKDILAFDYDEWCYTNMLENRDLNDSEIEVAQCNVLNQEELNQLTNGKNYDIILANLNRNLLNATFPKIKSLLKENTILITSGYYSEDEHYISEGVKEHLELERSKTLCKKNWTVNVYR